MVAPPHRVTSSNGETSSISSQKQAATTLIYGDGPIKVTAVSDNPSQQDTNVQQSPVQTSAAVGAPTSQNQEQTPIETPAQTLDAAGAPIKQTPEQTPIETQINRDTNVQQSPVQTSEKTLVESSSQTIDTPIERLPIDTPNATPPPQTYPQRESSPTQQESRLPTRNPETSQSASVSESSPQSPPTRTSPPSRYTDTPQSESSSQSSQPPITRTLPPPRYTDTPQSEPSSQSSQPPPTRSLPPPRYTDQPQSESSSQPPPTRTSPPLRYTDPPQSEPSLQSSQPPSTRSLPPPRYTDPPQSEPSLQSSQPPSTRSLPPPRYTDPPQSESSLQSSPPPPTRLLPPPRYTPQSSQPPLTRPLPPLTDTSQPESSSKSSQPPLLPPTDTPQPESSQPPLTRPFQQPTNNPESPPTRQQPSISLTTPQTTPSQTLIQPTPSSSNSQISTNNPPFTAAKPISDNQSITQLTETLETISKFATSLIPIKAPTTVLTSVIATSIPTLLTSLTTNSKGEVSTISSTSFIPTLTTVELSLTLSPPEVEEPTTIPVPDKPPSALYSTESGFKQIVTSGYGNCGQVQFNDFRVWYSKDQNRIAFNATGKSLLSLQQGQVRLFVYFDPSHKIFTALPACKFAPGNDDSCQIGGIESPEFLLNGTIPTGFDDALPEILFNVPGTGSYAMLTIAPNTDQNDNIDTSDPTTYLGCVSAPVGNPKTYSSDAVAGLTIGTGIARPQYAIEASFLAKPGQQSSQSSTHSGNNNDNESQISSYHDGGNHNYHTGKGHYNSGNNSHSGSNINGQNDENVGNAEYHNDNSNNNYNHPGNQDPFADSHSIYNSSSGGNYDTSGTNNSFNMHNDNNYNQQRPMICSQGQSMSNPFADPTSTTDSSLRVALSNDPTSVSNGSGVSSANNPTGSQFGHLSQLDGQSGTDSVEGGSATSANNTVRPNLGQLDGNTNTAINVNSNGPGGVGGPNESVNTASMKPHPSQATPTQTPSIYDFINCAQFIVTTGLLALPNLPIGYRQFASNFGWSSGAGTGINIQVFSNAANKIRSEICSFASNCSSSLFDFNDNGTCGVEQAWALNSELSPPENLFAAKLTDGNITTFTNPAGISSYANTLHVPASNLFFIVMITFLIAVGVAIVLSILAGVVARCLKKYWKKYLLLKKAGENYHLLAFGGVLRVLIAMYYPLTLFCIYELSIHNDCWLLLLLAALILIIFSLVVIIYCGYKIFVTMDKDPDALWENTTYQIVYGALYTQYLDDRVWFFVPTMVYNFFRAVIVGGGQNSGVGQLTGLSLLEFAYMFGIYSYKPFERPMANRLTIGLGTVRIIVLALLIPFVGGHVVISPSTRIYLAIVLIVLQSLTIIFTAGLILVNVGGAVWKLVSNKFFKKEDGDNGEKLNGIRNEYRNDTVDMEKATSSMSGNNSSNIRARRPTTERYRTSI
ncbi:2349_t:CDS:2 [Ambispora gerdemannii]|uniref:2349_t:CDS:1 n=1 Tax=Ambispora gerdemannii TaxID=144530 RepID=A0A9N9CA56_9GLOM|nr:2349_t:CDS:2 [Ambispora gerdemannii]